VAGNAAGGRRAICFPKPRSSPEKTVGFHAARAGGLTVDRDGGFRCGGPQKESDQKPPEGIIWMPHADVLVDFEMFQGYRFPIRRGALISGLAKTARTFAN